jgi:hypothetical protein
MATPLAHPLDLYNLEPALNLCPDEGRLAPFQLNTESRTDISNAARAEMREGEKWMNKKERRKAQNRIAQRKFRQKEQGRLRDGVFEGQHEPLFPFLLLSPRLYIWAEGQ